MDLMTMSEFVRAQRKTLPAKPTPIDDIVGPMASAMNNVMRYERFLSQKLQLEMFVPAADIRELPDGEKAAPESNAFFPELEDKVLFKDLQINYTSLDKHYHIKKKNNFFVVSGKKGMFNNNLTIEDLVHRDLELTDVAIKSIFG